jgi:hypothetical protein
MSDEVIRTFADNTERNAASFSDAEVGKLVRVLNVAGAVKLYEIQRAGAGSSIFQDTAGGGGGGSSGLKKISMRVTHSGGGGDFELTDAGLSQTFVSPQTIPRGGAVASVHQEVDTLAAGPGLTVLTLSMELPYPVGPFDAQLFSLTTGNGINNAAAHLSPSFQFVQDQEGLAINLVFVSDIAMQDIAAFDATFTFGVYVVADMPEL